MTSMSPLSGGPEDTLSDLGYALEKHLASAKAVEQWPEIQLEPKPGETLGKFLIKSERQAGGQARVFLAIDTDLQREVILKLYHASGTQRDRIYAEARTLARVKSPYLPECYEVYRHQGTPIVAQEYIDGKTLPEYAASGLSQQEVVRLIAGVAAGVAAVHAAGFIHRDLKPSNILVDTSGAPRLIDFGLSTPVALVTGGDYSGTTAYMAPERANDELAKIDQRTDVFGIGAVLYELLTDKAPFEAETKERSLEKARSGHVEPLSDSGAKIDSRIAALCMDCLQKDPALRPTSASEVADRLRSTARKGTRSSWFPKFALFGSLVILAISVGLLLNQSLRPHEPALSVRQDWSRIVTSFEANPSDPVALQAGLSRDFSLTVSFSGFPKNKQNVYEIPCGVNYGMLIESDQPCYVEVYCVTFARGSDTPAISLLFPANKGEIRPVTPENSVTLHMGGDEPTDRAEFYYVVGHEVGDVGAKVSPTLPVRTDASTSEKAPTWRSSKRVLRKSEVLIPYFIR